MHGYLGSRDGILQNVSHKLVCSEVGLSKVFRLWGDIATLLSGDKSSLEELSYRSLEVSISLRN